MFIRNVLEDGEALAHLGVTDEDQSLVENAYHTVYDWIMLGKTYLDEVAHLVSHG